MPALSSSRPPSSAISAVFIFALIALIALVIVLARQKLLSGSIFISASKYQSMRMSTQMSGSEKETQYNDSKSDELVQQKEPLTMQTSHTRSLSSQLPEPTIMPYVLASPTGSNAEYFSNSPISETTTFSSFSENTVTTASNPSPSESQPKRRSYNKTLSFPLPSPLSPKDYFQMTKDANVFDGTIGTVFPPPSSSSFPQSMYPAPLLGPNGEQMPMMQEVQVEGEILVSEGWRRHTRVFGGGVCKACEESEEEMRRRGSA